jgi:pilus assembly protein CpaB
MNKRFVSVLIFAFVVAAGASVLFWRFASSRIDASAKAPTMQVMVAGRDLPVGTLIGDLDVKVGAWSGPLPANAVVKKEDAVGRGVVASIYAGEPILESRLATRGAGAGMAATIPPGMRAVAVRVNEVVGVAGFVVPGLRVDVLVMGTPPSGSTSTGTIIKTILQNIEVLSAGQNIQKDTEGKPVTVQVVNLLVTPEQAEVLSLVSNDMRIQLILRNPLDNKETKTPGAAAANIFSGVSYKAPGSDQAEPRPRPVRKEPPKPAVSERVYVPIVVEVIQGTKRNEVKFRDQSETGQSGNAEVGK